MADRVSVLMTINDRHLRKFPKTKTHSDLYLTCFHSYMQRQWGQNDCRTPKILISLDEKGFCIFIFILCLMGIAQTLTSSAHLGTEDKDRSMKNIYVECSRITAQTILIRNSQNEQMVSRILTTAHKSNSSYIWVQTIEQYLKDAWIFGNCSQSYMSCMWEKYKMFRQICHQQPTIQVKLLS